MNGRAQRRGLTGLLTGLVLMQLTGCLSAGTGASDPYAAWSQGRPGESIPALAHLAEAGGRWDQWYDLGLAAAAAGDRGRAAAWLLRAWHIAPERREPRQALLALGIHLPEGALQALGPLAWPGLGWQGLALLALSGAALGFAISRGRRRGLLALGVATLVLAAPGQIGRWIDTRDPLVAVVRDTALLDSTGAPIRPLPAGTLVHRDPRPVWQDRMLVTLSDGQRGYVTVEDGTARIPRE